MNAGVSSAGDEEREDSRVVYEGSHAKSEPHLSGAP